MQPHVRDAAQNTKAASRVHGAQQLSGNFGAGSPSPKTKNDPTCSAASAQLLMKCHQCVSAAASPLSKVKSAYAMGAPETRSRAQALKSSRAVRRKEQCLDLGCACSRSPWSRISRMSRGLIPACAADTHSGMRCQNYAPSSAGAEFCYSSPMSPSDARSCVICTLFVLVHEMREVERLSSSSSVWASVPVHCEAVWRAHEVCLAVAWMKSESANTTVLRM